jgi:hypothetical protein
MAEHAPQDRHRAAPAAKAVAPHVAMADAPVVASLGDTADSLNASRPVVALKALGAQLSGRAAAPPLQRAVAPPSPNRTGLPDRLKHGVEALSGVSLDAVRVHRDSPKPAQLQALAYAQGTDIHLAPGQERHLPHETWHVVQQAQGRVKPTRQMKTGVGINDDAGLESEADAMGAKALQLSAGVTPAERRAIGHMGAPPIQRAAGIEYETSIEARVTADYQPLVNAKSGWVDQDEKMAQAEGWQIDSDNSKLEFVTYPPTELDTLEETVSSMLDVVDTLPLTLGANRDLGELLGVETTKPYTVLKYAKPEITGAPQGTVGIPFEKLFAFFNLLTTYQMKMSDMKVAANQGKMQRAWANYHLMPEDDENVEDEEGGPKQKAKKALTAYGKALKIDKASHGAIRPDHIAEFKKVGRIVDGAVKPIEGVEKKDIDTLKGLLHFIGQYVIYGSAKGDGYEKKRFPVMARSSFASMYAALKPDVQEKFRDAADDVIKQLEFSGETVLLPGRQGVSFTVDTWLDSIVSPEDIIIPGEEDRVMQSDYMTAPGAKKYHNGPLAFDTDKSMGNMGLDGGLVVIELRNFRLGSSKNSFPVAAARKLIGDLKRLTA